MARRFAVALLGLALALGGPAAVIRAEPPPPADDAPWGVLGAADAPVVLTEFTSPAAPSAAVFQAKVFPAFKAKYIDTGLVRLEVREILTGQAAVAAASFLLARCAGRENYLAVLDRIFQAQPEMFADGTVSHARATLEKIGQDFGLSPRRFDACIIDTPALQALNTRAQAAADYTLGKTPSFQINGVLYRGEPTLKGLSTAIDPLLPR